MSAAVGGKREDRVALEAGRALASAVETGGAVVLRVPEAPDSPMLNRVVGLGTPPVFVARRNSTATG